MRGLVLLALATLGCPSRSEDAGRRGSWAPGLTPVTGSASAAVSANGARPKSPPFPGTTAPTERRHGPAQVPRLMEVRAARHDEGYVRVVFEFERELPGYRIRYIEPPVRKCGSGDPTAVAGNARLEVQLSPANAHDEKGAPTVQDRERSPALGILRELELTCDFEAETVWVLGLDSQNPYRVLELGEPPRIVVDVLE